MLRKNLAAERQQRFLTGGGKIEHIDINNDDPFLPLVQQSVEPLPNQYDSSAELFTDIVSTAFKFGLFTFVMYAGIFD